MRNSLVLILVLVIACSPATDTDQYPLMPDSLMIKVMADAFVLNAAFADTWKEKKDSLSKLYTDQLMEKYQIEEEQFQENLDRVHANPEKLDSILDGIINRIDDLEADYIDTRAGVM